MLTAAPQRFLHDCPARYAAQRAIHNVPCPVGSNELAMQALGDTVAVDIPMKSGAALQGAGTHRASCCGASVTVKGSVDIPWPGSVFSR